jgi:hypothetical protein
MTEAMRELVIGKLIRFNTDRMKPCTECRPKMEFLFRQMYDAATDDALMENVRDMKQIIEEDEWNLACTISEEDMRVQAL